MGASAAKQQWSATRIPAGRTAIVTGASAGIGYEVAKHLALMGAKVILGCRSKERAEEAVAKMKSTLAEYKSAPGLKFGYSRENLPDDLDLHLLTLDLSSLKSVKNFINELKQSGYSPDILVCNAGIGIVPLSYTEDGYESQFQVNYLGHFLLTLHLLPIMLQSQKECRIINVSSLSHRNGCLDLDNIQAKQSYNRLNFYGNSKLFQLMNMYSLVRRLKGSRVTVNSIHPGYINTEIDRNFKDSTLFRNAWKAFSYIPGWMSDQETGAAGAINAAVNPALEGVTGVYYDEGVPTTPYANARNEKNQEILWKYSLDCLKDYVTPDLLENLKYTTEERETGS